MKKLLNRLRADTVGATAIEYGLIVAIIAIVLIGSLNLIGTNLTSTFSMVGSTIENAGR